MPTGRTRPPTAWRYLEADHVHWGVVTGEPPMDWSQLVNLLPVMIHKAAQNFRSQHLNKKIKDEAECCLPRISPWPERIGRR